MEGTLAVELLVFQSFAKFFGQKMTGTVYILLLFPGESPQTDRATERFGWHWYSCAQR